MGMGTRKVGAVLVMHKTMLISRLDRNATSKNAGIFHF
jgi:hypothetical protein